MFLNFFVRFQRPAQVVFGKSTDNTMLGGGGFFHSESTWGFAARKVIIFACNA